VNQVNGSGAIPMRFCILTAACVVVTLAGTAQDLAPEVLLLARIKSHMREQVSQIPFYTCLETIVRFHKEPGRSTHVHEPLKPLDVVRLEIVYSNHREWYGSPGDRNLSMDNPVAFVGSGMIGNGAFAATLNNIIAGASFVYRGEETLGGRTAVKYDFRLPAMLKGLTISIPGGKGTVGEEGSLWVDPQSLDLIRVESRADEIPPYLPLEQASTNVNYARMRIGDYNVLLAQQADLHMLAATGVEDFDRLEFTHCRAYSAESIIRFDRDQQDPPKALPATSAPISPAPDRASQSVPALLLITVQLSTSISDKDAVGTLIEGKVSGDVLRKGKILIPKGSTVRGRIRRLERYQGGAAFIVGLEFTEVAVRGGGSLLFYADLLRIDKNPRIQPTLFERVLVPDTSRIQTREETITLPELPGVASFFVGGMTFTIPNTFHMVWRTRGPIR
jgi:hypothetical protein